MLSCGRAATTLLSAPREHVLSPLPGAAVDQRLVLAGEGLAVVSDFADVRAVAENSAHGGLSPWAAAEGRYAVTLQVASEGGHCVARDELRKHAPDDHCLGVYGDKTSVDVAVPIGSRPA